MIRLSDDALLALDPRRELGRIRAALDERLSRDAPVEPLLRAIAERDRLALAELLVGPRARVDGQMVRAALAVVDLLEDSIRPGALYRRLTDLAADAALDVLRSAVHRHPKEDWLVTLSVKVEGPNAGWTHLEAMLDTSAFSDLCRVYAQRGAREALVQLVQAHGVSDPMVAFVEVGNRDGLVRAAVMMIEHHPHAPLVPLLAALWGPDLESLLGDVIGEVSSSDALQELARQARAYPRAAARVGARLATT